MPKNCPMGKIESHACWDCIYYFGNSCTYTALEVIKNEHEKETPAQKCSKCFHYNVCGLWTTTDLDEDKAYKYCYNHFISAEDIVPVRHGEWKYRRWTTECDWGCINHRSITCSACKVEFVDTEPTNYCPNCGAKMDEGEEK